MSKRDDQFGELRQALAVLDGHIPEHLGDTLGQISAKLDTAQRDVIEMKAMMRLDFVSRHEFEPVKKVVWGMVGLVLAAVLTALIALVVQR